MSSMTDAFETALLQLLFNNAALANVGTDQGILGSSTATGSTQLSLASIAYTDASSDMTTNELTYGGYARPTQERSASGWTISTAVASNAASIVFGEMASGGPVTAVHVGLSFVGTGNVLQLQADLTADLVINNGINPTFAIGALTWTAA